MSLCEEIADFWSIGQVGPFELWKLGGVALLELHDVRWLDPFEDGEIQAERRDTASHGVRVAAEYGFLQKLAPLAECKLPAVFPLGERNKPPIGGRQENAGSAGTVENGLGQRVRRVLEGLIDCQSRQMPWRVEGPLLGLLLG